MKWIRVAGLVVVTVLTVAALQAVVAGSGAEDAIPLAESSRVFIEPRTLSVDEGDLFTVTVMVENAQDMVGYAFEMSWHSSVLTVTEPHVTDAGSLLEEPITSLNLDASEGVLSFEALVFPPPYEDGADGDFPLAVITLQAVGTGASRLDLDGADVEWTDSELSQHIPSEVYDGRVLVGMDFFAYLPVALRSHGP